MKKEKRTQGLAEPELAVPGGLQRRSRLGSVQLESRADDQLPRITGHAAVFNSDSEDLGWYIERILPGAFAEALRSYDVVCLANHNGDRLVAATKNRTLSLREDSQGLYMEADPMDTQVCRDLVTEIRSGALDGQSFSFTIGSASWSVEDGVDVRTISKVERVWDVGPVVFPAYPQTDVSARDLLAAAGLDVEGFSRALVKKIRQRPLTPADHDIVRRAAALLQAADEDSGGQAAPESDEAAPPAGRRLSDLRRRLDLALAE